MKKIKFLEKYFWDVDFSKLDKKKHSKFIIERILEFGDEKAVAWLLKNYKKDEIKKVLISSKRLSKKSANFWSIIFDIPKDKILCLKKSFQNQYRKIWKF